MVFRDYARFYNLFYRSKDYSAETEYIIELFKRHNKSVETLLDLGCGTGQHDIHFTQHGYKVTGVDLSEEMLSIAEKNNKSIRSNNDALTFLCSDIRDLRLRSTFDAVVSLFHVMSYQPTNSDLIDTMTTARVHLETGGIFVFDFWYGPGVLTDPPETRAKKYREDEIEVTRISEPLLLHNKNLVEVCYQLLIKENGGQISNEIREKHTMRYLFTPELELMLERAGFEILALYEYMTFDEPMLNSWNACMVAEAV